MRAMSGSELRIGVIADIHAGADHGSQLGSRAFPLLDEFVRVMGRFQPDLVVDLGDRVNNESRTQDELHMREVIERIHRLGNVRHVPGNHDLVHLTVKDNEALTSQPQDDRCEVLHGRPMLFLNTEAAAPDMERLLAGISHVPRGLLIVFSHRPLVPVPLSRNTLFPPGELQNPSWGPASVDELVRLGWMPFCVNAHLHWNHVLSTRSSTHVTVGSLVEAWECAGGPSGSFAEVVVEPDGTWMGVTIEVHVLGRLACHYKFALECGG